MAENMLPKGAPVQQIAAFLANNPRATGVVLGVTAAGYTLPAISEYATDDSTLKKHRYLWSLVVGVAVGLSAWGYYAKRPAQRSFELPKTTLVPRTLLARRTAVALSGARRVRAKPFGPAVEPSAREAAA
jgi:hypothetical protein